MSEVPLYDADGSMGRRADGPTVELEVTCWIVLRTHSTIVDSPLFEPLNSPTQKAAGSIGRRAGDQHRHSATPSWHLFQSVWSDWVEGGSTTVTVSMDR